MVSGEATVIAAGKVGKVSVNVTPVSVSFWFGFAIVKVKVDVPLTRIGFGENNLEMAGGRTAVSVSVAEPVVVLLVNVLGFPPPSRYVAEINPLTLVCGPVVVAVTLTLTVQELFAASVAPVGLPKVSELEPAAGDQVGEPPHVVLADGVAATCNPEGRESVKVMPLKATDALGLVMVKVSVETPLTAMGSGEKDLVSVGYWGTPQPVKVTPSI